MEPFFLVAVKKAILHLKAWLDHELRSASYHGLRRIDWRSVRQYVFYLTCIVYRQRTSSSGPKGSIRLVICLG